MIQNTELYGLYNLPLRFRKAGRVSCVGAREINWATCHNRVTPSKATEFLKSPCFLDLNVIIILRLTLNSDEYSGGWQFSCCIFSLTHIISFIWIAELCEGQHIIFPFNSFPVDIEKLGIFVPLHSRSRITVRRNTWDREFVSRIFKHVLRRLFKFIAEILIVYFYSKSEVN